VYRIFGEFLAAVARQRRFCQATLVGGWMNARAACRSGHRSGNDTSLYLPRPPRMESSGGGHTLDNRCGYHYSVGPSFGMKTTWIGKPGPRGDAEGWPGLAHDRVSAAQAMTRQRSPIGY
jgi:hypothetical protein